jgi:hypothetical protein
VADIRIAGEQASSVPIQSMGTRAFAVPDSCTSLGLPPQETVEALAANGILGVGLFQQDCGPACTVAGSQNPGLCYSCPLGSGCVPAAVPLTQQLTNPVALFPVDNNGVILQLPSVPTGGEASARGSMIFGIGTQSNNGMGSALVYPVDGVGNFTTVFQGRAYPASYLDSGTNGIYFLDSSTTGMPTCPDTSDFYCPATTELHRDEPGRERNEPGRQLHDREHGRALQDRQCGLQQPRGPEPGLVPVGAVILLRSERLHGHRAANDTRRCRTYFAY